MASAVSSTGQLRTRRRSIIVVGLAVMVGVVVVSAGLLINHTRTPASTVQSQRFPGQPMRDALGLFSATIPEGWTVAGKEYLHVGCIGTVCHNMEVYTFSDQHPGDTQVTVTIQATASNSSDMPYCPSYSNFGGNGYTKTTVDGLPAVFFNGHQLSFASGNAGFDISINIPTHPRPESLTGPAAPTVTDAASANTQAQAIISSIRVTNRGTCT